MKTFALTFLGIFIFIFLNAQNYSEFANALNLKNLKNIYPIENYGAIYSFENGFLIFNSKGRLVGFSTESSLQTDNPYFYQFLDFTKNLLKSSVIDKNQKLLPSALSDADSIGPLLASEYGQVNCKDDKGNYIYVTNYYTPNHYAVGCVALTFATVMRYFNWPVFGSGYHQYTDSYGSFTGTYSADFENTNYQWDKILDKYYKVPSDEENRQALGRVSFDAAVSVDMDFEPSGSTSNINRIPSAVSKYFRYERPIYKTSTSDDFWQLIDSSINALSPVILAVYTDNGAGHAVVCDGIKFIDSSTQFYHLNMGWWGAFNGWYDIQGDFNAGGYTTVSAAVMGFLPLPQILEPSLDLETNQITLRWLYSPRFQNPTFELQIKVDDNDWFTVADTFTVFSYTFTANLNSKYYFRIKTNKNSTWSEEVYFNPQSVLAKYDTVSVFPTLATDFIFVQYKNLKNSTIKIFDVSGKVIYSELVNDDVIKKRIDIQSLTPGIYIIGVYIESSQEFFKFVKN